MNKLKIWHISDTHMQHIGLNVPEVDIVIHSGDATNYKNYALNSNEFYEFLDWYKKLDIKHKIFIAGNHDCFALKHIHKKEMKEEGVIYLENETIEVENIKIFGSPMTPTFGEWSFMADRSKLYKYWDLIEEGTNIVVTHGPPHGILDLGERGMNTYELAGCKSLLRKIIEINPSIHQFGHLHAHGPVLNNGIYEGPLCDTKFINCSCVTDRMIDDGVTSHGYISEWNDGKLVGIIPGPSFE